MCLPTTNPFDPVPPPWKGPVCPSCGRGYIQPNTTTDTFKWLQPYKPKHRKPGPAL